MSLFSSQKGQPEHPREAMSLFKMRGAYSPLTAALYNAVVAPALVEIYQRQSGRYLAGEAIRAGMRVLDVGCGMGYALGLISRQHPEVSLTGVDLSDHMVAMARQRHQGAPNLSFRRGDAMELPFERETFDLVLSMASIKHWPEPLRGLSEVRRVLKPAGSVLVMEADSECTREAASNFVRLWRWTAPLVRPLVTEYFLRIVAGQGMSAGELESLFRLAGMERVQVEAMTDYPAVVARAVKLE